MKEGQHRRSHGVTWKSVAITLVLIPFNFYWIIAGEVGLRRLCLEYVRSPILQRRLRRFCLHFTQSRCSPPSLHQCGTPHNIHPAQHRLCAFPSITLMTILVTTVGHAFWFATPENEWKQLFWDYLPRWLLVDDPKVLAGYYIGETNLSTLDILSAWIVPVLSWAGFMTVLCPRDVVYQRHFAEAVG